MQKTYWWRVSLVVVCVSILIGSYMGPCEYRLGKCFGGNSILFVRTMFHFSLSLLATSPLLFFISDRIFLKWLRFALVWFFLAIIFIMLAPEYSGGFGPNLGITKELVSIWMGILFVVISIMKLIWDSRWMKKD